MSSNFILWAPPAILLAFLLLGLRPKKATGQPDEPIETPEEAARAKAREKPFIPASWGLGMGAFASVSTIAHGQKSGISHQWIAIVVPLILGPLVGLFVGYVHYLWITRR